MVLAHQEKISSEWTTATTPVFSVLSYVVYCTKLHYNLNGIDWTYVLHDDR